MPWKLKLQRRTYPACKICLHYDCLLKNPEIIELLPQHGSDLNIKDNNGNMPFHDLLLGRELVEEKLIEYSIDRLRDRTAKFN